MCTYTYTYLITYSFIHSFMTYSTEQSPSWEANNSSPSHQIPITVWNLMVHYYVQHIPSLVLIACHINPVRNIQSYLLFINFKIILPPTPCSSVASLSFRFSHQHPACIFLPSHPSHSRFKYWVLVFINWWTSFMVFCTSMPH